MLTNLTIVASVFLSLFATGELLYHKLKVKAEFSRKFVHLFTGIFTFLLPELIGDYRIVFGLCLSFGILLYASKKYGFLKSINAIDRPSQGSLWYPFIIYGCYYTYHLSGQYIYFYLPILILAISDPLAALSGKRWPKGKFVIGCHTKTVIGSLVFLFSAFIISLFAILIFCSMPILTAIYIAIVISGFTTISEALSRNGLDNFTIPASALLVLIFIEKFTGLF